MFIKLVLLLLCLFRCFFIDANEVIIENVIFVIGLFYSLGILVFMWVK